MSCKESAVCSWTGDGPFPFEGDSDIAGIGVVLALVVTAGLSFLLLMAVYLLADEDYLYRSEPSFVDKMARAPIWFVLKQLRLRRIAGPRVKLAVQKTAILLTDQQLITGAAILVVGFVQHCSITQYYLAVTNSLSWLAFSTVDLSIRIAAERLCESGSMRLWRSLWVCCLFISIVLSNLVVLTAGFVEHCGMSTQCVWDQLAQDSQFSNPQAVLGSVSTANATLTIPPTILGVDQREVTIESSRIATYVRFYLTGRLLLMLASDLLLLWQLWSFIQAMYPSLRPRKLLYRLRITTRLPVYLDQLIAKRRQSLSGTSAAATNTYSLMLLMWPGILALCLARCITVPLSVLAITISGFLESQLLEHLRVFILIFVGTHNIYALRTGAKDQGMQGDEDTWGFGQVLPLFLLALPVTAILDSFYGEEDGKTVVCTQCQSVPTRVQADFQPGDTGLWIGEPGPQEVQEPRSLTQRVNVFERRLADNLYFKWWFFTFVVLITVALVMFSI